MSNHLTPIIQQFIGHQDSVLDLCCGILGVTDTIQCGTFDGVDACEDYIERAKKVRPMGSFCLCDVLNFLKFARGYKMGWDVVMCIDGLEHLEQNRARLVLKNMMAVSKKAVLVFTPTTLTTNHPKHTWGIKSTKGDSLQKHLCFFPKNIMLATGFRTVYSETINNIYNGKPYTNNLYVWFNPEVAPTTVPVPKGVLH